MLSFKQCGIKYPFWIFEMSRSGIEPRSPGPLENTQLIRQMAIYSKTNQPTNQPTKQTNKQKNPFKQVTKLVIFTKIFRFSLYITSIFSSFSHFTFNFLSRFKFLLFFKSSLQNQRIPFIFKFIDSILKLFFRHCYFIRLLFFLSFLFSKHFL